MSKNRRQSLPFIIVTTALASCISMIGGVGIEFTEKELLPIVPLIIALPALNTMVGDYATIIAAHAGNPAQKHASRRKLIKAIIVSAILNVIGTISMSLLLSQKRGYESTTYFLGTFTLFVLFSVSAIVAVMFTITYALDKILESKNLNPDDILIPIVTTITDVFMLGLIALAAKFLF